MKQEKPSSNESWGNTATVSGSLIRDLTATITEQLLHPRMRFLSHGTPALILTPILALRSWIAHSLAHTLTHISATYSLTSSSTASLCHTSAPSVIQLRMNLLTCGFSPFFSHWLIDSIPSVSHPSPSLIIHTHTHSASQIPTHALIHLSMTSFFQLYSHSLIQTSSELVYPSFHRSCW